jgi:hypothetical protein
VRYADDWLLGFAGPKHEAEEIKSEIGLFLREKLKLDLSDAKTMITHATTKAARFLGYDPAPKAIKPMPGIRLTARGSSGAWPLSTPVRCTQR